jgi:hypothetical protein
MAFHAWKTVRGLLVALDNQSTDRAIRMAARIENESYSSTENEIDSRLRLRVHIPTTFIVFDPFQRNIATGQARTGLSMEETIVIGRALEQNTRVLYFAFQCNLDMDVDLGRVLRSIGSLGGLSLCQPPLGTLRAILPSFGSHNNLRLVNFSSCRLTAEDAAVIATTLLQNGSVLEMLILSNNHLGSDGARALAGGLAGNTMLHTLDLTHCVVGIEGAAALGAALPQCNLCELDLSINWMEHAGEMSILNGVKASKTMRALMVGPKFAYSYRFGFECFKMAMVSSVFDRLYLRHQPKPSCHAHGAGINWGGERRYDIDARCSVMRGMLSTSLTGAKRPNCPISIGRNLKFPLSNVWWSRDACLKLCGESVCIRIQARS